MWERHRFSRWPCRRSAVPASVAPTPAGPGWHSHSFPRGSDIRRLVCPSFVVRRHGLQPAVSDNGRPRIKQCANRADVGAICRRAGAIEYYPGRKDRQTAPRRLVRLERKSWLPDARPSRATSDPGRLFGVRQFIAALVRPASAARSAPLTSLCVFHIGQSGDESPHSKGASARVRLLGWAGPETVCLEQAVRGGAKRTGARAVAQIRAVWERHRFSRWPCRRSAVPASVAPTPAGPGWHSHSFPRGSDIRRLVCPSFVVRRHGLQPAVSDNGRPRIKQCANRADVGAICRRAGAIEYYPGRKDRQTAPRRLVRLERKSWLPDARPSRATSDPGRLFGSAAIHCRFGTARERAAPAHLSPLSAFSTSAKAAMNRRTPKAPARGRPCSAGRDPKPCGTAWNKRCGAARNEQGHGRLPKSVRCGNALGFRVGLAADWVCLLRPLPRRPDRCATPTAVPRGSDIRRLVCPCFVVRRHGLQPAVSDYGCPRVKQGQTCGRRGNLPEGRSDRILPRQERSSNRSPPACPAGAEVLVARRTAFPRHVRPRSARPTGEGVLLATRLANLLVLRAWTPWSVACPKGTGTVKLLHEKSG